MTVKKASNSKTYITVDPTLAGLQLVNGIVNGTTPDPSVNEGLLVDKSDGGDEFDVVFSVLDKVGLVGSNPGKTANFHYYIPVPQEGQTISEYVDRADFTLNLKSVAWGNEGVCVSYTTDTTQNPDSVPKWTKLSSGTEVPEGVRWLKINIENSATFAGTTSTPITLRFQARDYDISEQVVFNAGGVPALKDSVTSLWCKTGSVSIGVASADYKVIYRYYNADGRIAWEDTAAAGTAIVGEKITNQPENSSVVKGGKTYTLQNDGTLNSLTVQPTGAVNELIVSFYENTYTYTVQWLDKDGKDLKNTEVRGPLPIKDEDGKAVTVTVSDDDKADIVLDDGTTYKFDAENTANVLVGELSATTPVILKLYFTKTAIPATGMDIQARYMVQYLDKDGNQLKTAAVRGPLAIKDKDGKDVLIL